MNRFDTRLVGGVEPRRMRMALLAAIGGLASVFALLGPEIPRIPLLALVGGALGALLGLALVRAVWRRVEGRRPVVVTASAVSHAGVSIDRRRLEVERSQWIRGGRVGLVATLRDGVSVLTLGGLGIARDVDHSERRGRVFVDACVGDVGVLERLLRSSGAPAPAPDAPYRAKGGSEERSISVVASAPPLAWWRGLVDAELAIALTVSLAVSSSDLVVALTWLAVTLRKVLRTWRDEPIPLPLHTLRTRGAGLVVESGGERFGETDDASASARLGRFDGRACLEVRLGAATPTRFVSTSSPVGAEEMYSPDYDVGPEDFEWLVRFTRAASTRDPERPPEADAAPAAGH